MTQKEKDVTNYIINEVIFFAKKSVPFNPNDLISSFPVMKMAPFKNGESLEASIYALLVSIPDLDDYIDILLKDGFIKRLLDDSNKYLLTDKGEKAQDAGSIENYKRIQTKKDRADNYLRYVGYVLPIVTILSLIIAIFSYFKKTNTYIINEIKIDSSLIKKDVIKLIKKDTNNSNSPNSY